MPRKSSSTKSDGDAGSSAGQNFRLRLMEKNIPDEELLADLRRAAAKSGEGRLSTRIYAQFGNYSETIMRDRFGTWNKALMRADLPISMQMNIPESELFENLEHVWTRLGRQPRYRDMTKPHSKFGGSPYLHRFGSWNRALKAFVHYVREAGITGDQVSGQQNAQGGRRTCRNISNRLKIRVWLRDKHKCVFCGRSPATDLKVILHVDHILPWSKGGKTELENLQSLCSKCNLGKGNLEQPG